jgi:magnesium chelatase family protein
MAAMVGGGTRVKPGEASLAHHGVLFLDELPEFHPQVLDSLRQPLETGEIAVVRANSRVVFPAQFQLIAAINPCRCRWGGQNGQACAKGPKCAQSYQARVSGPMMNRIDLHVDVPAVTPADLTLPPSAEGTTEVAARVEEARNLQKDRGCLNARLTGPALDEWVQPDTAGRTLLAQASEKLGLTARGYHRVLRVSRTIADLEGQESVKRVHIAEALSSRQSSPATKTISVPKTYLGLQTSLT